MSGRHRVARERPAAVLAVAVRGVVSAAAGAAVMVSGGRLTTGAGPVPVRSIGDAP
jgi:hypothetical protein